MRIIRCLDCRASGAVAPEDVDLVTLACTTRRHAVAVFYDDHFSAPMLGRLDSILATTPVASLPPTKISATPWFRELD